MKRFYAILIDHLDFESYPTGGQLNFARQMMKVYGNRLALVGTSTDGTPVGRWVKKKFDGIEYSFFAVSRSDPNLQKPFIPLRLTAYVGLKLHKSQILSIGIRDAFIQAPEALMAVQGWGWDTICYLMPGVESALSVSKYKWAIPFSDIFERHFFSALRKADVLLAAADNNSIQDMVLRTRGLISRERIIQFPTRADTDIFRPRPKMEARRELSLSECGMLFVSSGRLHWAKGWELLLDVLSYIVLKNKDARLVFIGDGPDRGRILAVAKSLGLANNVAVTGVQPSALVARYINACDVFLMGSFKEGWSTAMVEALACGKPIVTTNVSSAREIVQEGVNGYVVQTRCAKDFAEAILKSMELEGVREFSLSSVDRYAQRNLGRDLGRLWKPLSLDGNYQDKANTNPWICQSGSLMRHFRKHCQKLR